MITAKQAREKQLTINWKDNEKAVKTYKKEKEEMLKEIEEEIHNALIGEDNFISYFIFTNKLHDLALVTSWTKYKLAHADLVKDIEKELIQLGYKITVEHAVNSYEKWWKIEW